MTSTETASMAGFVPIQVCFWNETHGSVHLWYMQDMADDLYFGKIGRGRKKVFNSFVGHTWYTSHSRKPVKRFSVHNQMVVIEESKFQYSLTTTEARRAAEALREERKERFRAQYMRRTGREWEQVYPRGSVMFPMYNPGTVGECYDVPIRTPSWQENRHGPPDGNLHRILAKERTQETLKLRAMSLSPVVLMVNNLLSADECRHIIDISRNDMKPSAVTTKATVSSVRKSSNTFLPRWKSPVVNNLFNRVADLCRLDRAYLRHDMCAEFLQVVKYTPGQYYKEHHDYLQPVYYDDSPNVQKGNNRLITVLLYLRCADEGGTTDFPMAEGGRVVVVPEPGSATLFYNMLPDGNLDNRSLHCGTKITKGEKWIANLWIWCPRWK